MKILDKNKDFYDYVQYEYYDDTFTFDRRNSCILTKDEIAHYLPWSRQQDNKRYLLMQICHTFWLFELDVVYDGHTSTIAKDYTISLLHSWTNYNSNRELLKLSSVDFYRWFDGDIDLEYKVSTFPQLINTKNYEEYHVFNRFTIWRGNEKEERNIPILKETGIASVVDAHDIYNALEAYFGEEKTASERTEPIGATNDDKIVSHGFDTKTSFRN